MPDRNNRGAGEIFESRLAASRRRRRFNAASAPAPRSPPASGRRPRARWCQSASSSRPSGVSKRSNTCTARRPRQRFGRHGPFRLGEEIDQPSPCFGRRFCIQRPAKGWKREPAERLQFAVGGLSHVEFRVVQLFDPFLDSPGVRLRRRFQVFPNQRGDRGGRCFGQPPRGGLGLTGVRCGQVRPPTGQRGGAVVRRKRYGAGRRRKVPALPSPCRSPCW